MDLAIFEKKRRSCIGNVLFLHVLFFGLAINCFTKKHILCQCPPFFGLLYLFQNYQNLVLKQTEITLDSPCGRVSFSFFA